MTDDNVVRLYPDLIPDHDEDGDGFSDSTEVDLYEPPLPATILETGIIVPRDARRDWWERNRGAVEYRWYAVRFHGIRLPLYAGRYTTHAGRGLWKVTGRVWHWTHDTEGLILRTQASLDPNLTADARTATFIKADDARLRKIRWRRPAVAALVLFLALVIRWGIHAHPWWSALAGFLIAVALGMVGAQRHEVIPVIEMPYDFTLTTDLIIEAFIGATITKPDRVVNVLPPGPIRSGEGYLVRVALPGGMTFEDDAQPKARRLASGLGVARARIDFDPLDKEAPNAFEIYVSDVHPADMPVPEWPLLAVDRWDIWQPLPMGVQLRQRLEMLNVIFTSVLCGAAPRQGKTWTIRLPFLAGALDPSVQQDLFDFKGAGDWSMFDGIAGTLVEGPSDENVRALRDLLRDDIWPDVQRRAATIRELGSARAPGAKVSRELCADPTLRLHIRMLGVDECHIATEHPEYGEEICDLLRKVTAQAPAVGIVVALATQKPDADAVPTKIAGNMNTRIAGRCLSWQASSAILGTAAKAQGWEAETIGRNQQGTVIMLGAGDDAGASNDGALIRVCLVDGRQAEEICRRARSLRQSRVTVESVADVPRQRQPEPQVDPIVKAVLEKWPHPEVAAHQVQLAEAIGMKQLDLSAKLRSLGLRSQQVRAGTDGANRNGYYLADVQNLTKSDPP